MYVFFLKLLKNIFDHSPSLNHTFCKIKKEERWKKKRQFCKIEITLRIFKQGQRSKIYLQDLYSLFYLEYRYVNRIISYHGKC